MNPRDSADPRPEPSPGETDLSCREPEVCPPRPKAGTPIEVPILSEPPVVLKDPPAIYGGASHTW